VITSKAAVLTRPGGEWEIHQLTVEPPRDGEVLVRLAYSGLCYSDEHLRFGDVAQLPIVGGHEGAGVIEATGPGVGKLTPGDHVVLTFVASCGRCRWCASGRGNLCESAGAIGSGRMADGTFRFHGSGPPIPPEGVGGICALGTFSDYAVVSQDSCVKISSAVPLAPAALVSCGVLTGWGAAVRTAKVQVGDVVIVVGAGGVGLNGIQGARHAGAEVIIVVDPVQAKQELGMTLGATHAAASTAEAAEMARRLNPAAHGSDVTLICTGNLSADDVSAAFEATGRGGTIVIVGMSHDPLELNIRLPGTVLAGTERRVLGSFFGSCNPVRDIPLLLGLYQRGVLQLDQLISKTYALPDISAGYADLAAGRNVRGLIDFAAE
jgi:alcohol dehydrogenase (nicotinoprotein)